MTCVSNIGTSALALWTHYDDSIPPGFIQKRQALHVSILSVASFTGRLSSGIGSDILVKRFAMSRHWCLVVASILFAIGQLSAIEIENPNHLWAVSGLTGRKSQRCIASWAKADPNSCIWGSFRRLSITRGGDVWRSWPLPKVSRLPPASFIHVLHLPSSLLPLERG